MSGYEQFYTLVSDQAAMVPDSSFLEPSPEPGIAAQTGEIGSEILTGVCLQSPHGSDALGDGIDPVTGETLESYEDVQAYLESVPDSVGVVTDQFGHTGMDEGTVYIIQEDNEWPEKVKTQLDEAGIEYTDDEIEADVGEAYDTVVEIFETYVVDVLDNDVETEVIYTSEIEDSIEDYIGSFKTKHGIQDDHGVYETICLLTSPFGLSLIEDEQDLEPGSLSMIDPPRHHPYLFDLESDVSNIFAGPSRTTLDLYESHSIGLTYPMLSPMTDEITKEPGQPPVNSATLSELIETIEPGTEHLSEDPGALLATAFPQYTDAMADLVALQEAIDADQDEMKAMAETAVAEAAGVEEVEEIFANPEIYDLAYWGQQVSEHVAEQKEETGMPDAKETLYTNVIDDVETLIGES